MFVEQGAAGDFDGLSNGGQWDASTPPVATDEFPRVPFRHIVQHLPDHDPGALEGGFAAADERVGDNVFSEFHARGFVVHFCFHALAKEFHSKPGGLQACLQRPDEKQSPNDYQKWP